jgi:hypothetical protein
VPLPRAYRSSVWKAAAGAALLLAVVWVSFPAAPLSDVLPAELPDRETLGAWEKIEGEAETADLHVLYTLYVNPKRPALYEVTHYRMTRVVRSADGTSRQVPETEKVLWNPPKGRVPERIRCYERVGAGAGPASTVRWRTLEPDSNEYRTELRTGMSVYWLHRAALQQRDSPGPGKE